MELSRVGLSQIITVHLVPAPNQRSSMFRMTDWLQTRFDPRDVSTTGTQCDAFLSLPKCLSGRRRRTSRSGRQAESADPGLDWVRKSVHHDAASSHAITMWFSSLHTRHDAGLCTDANRKSNPRQRPDIMLCYLFQPTVSQSTMSCPACQSTHSLPISTWERLQFIAFTFEF